MKNSWDYVPDETAAAAIMGAIVDNLGIYSYFSLKKSTKIEAARSPDLEIPTTSFYRSMDVLQKIGAVVATGDRETSDGRSIKVYATAFDNIKTEMGKDGIGMKIILSDYGKRNPSLIVSKEWARPVIDDLKDSYDMSEGTFSYRGNEFHVLNAGKFDSTDKKWRI
jgi:hypothetical protein